jgi:hypothetical protein
MNADTEFMPEERSLVERHSVYPGTFQGRNIITAPRGNLSPSSRGSGKTTLYELPDEQELVPTVQPSGPFAVPTSRLFVVPTSRLFVVLLRLFLVIIHQLFGCTMGGGAEKHFLFIGIAAQLFRQNRGQTFIVTFDHCLV